MENKTISVLAEPDLHGMERLSNKRDWPDGGKVAYVTGGCLFIIIIYYFVLSFTFFCHGAVDSAAGQLGCCRVTAVSIEMTFTPQF